MYDLGTLASYVNHNIMEQYQVQAPEIVNQLGNFVFFQGICNLILRYQK